MPGRDNGFVARHYLPLADLDPRLAEAMLDVLGAEGIAAYVAPSTGHLGGYLEVHLPERPRDRLWVDREFRERAGALLAEHTSESALPDGAELPESDRLPGPDGATSSDGETPPRSDTPPRDEPRGEPPGGASHDAAVTPSGESSVASSGEPSFDEAWAQLVANYDRSSAEPVPSWPPSEDVAIAPWSPSADIEGQQMLPLDGLHAGDAPPSSVPRRIVRPAERGAGPLPSAASPADDARYGGEYDPLSILDEHFVPPIPPPVPAMRPMTKGAIAAIVIGFALIIASTLTDAIPESVALGVIGVVGGFATLVAGMRHDRSNDDDPDDGAVV